MSKNERTVRTLMAGLVFVAIGFVGTLDFGVGELPERPSRSPAGKDCNTAECGELTRVKKELANLAPVESTRDARTRAEISNQELKLLTEAGNALVAIFRQPKVEEVADDELAEVAEFLAETYERDDSGTVLDVMELAIGPVKSKSVITAVQATVTRLCAENRIRRQQCEPIKLALGANLSEGEPDEPPAKSAK